MEASLHGCLRSARNLRVETGQGRKNSPECQNASGFAPAISQQKSAQGADFVCGVMSRRKRWSDCQSRGAEGECRNYSGYTMAKYWHRAVYFLVLYMKESVIYLA